MFTPEAYAALGTEGAVMSHEKRLEIFYEQKSLAEAHSDPAGQRHRVCYLQTS